MHHYCNIYDATSRQWIPFKLWKSQHDTLSQLHSERLIIILKARQLGLTWLTVAYALWAMLFQPGSTVLMFSRRDEEAQDLLDRLRQMLFRLPTWLRPTIATDNAHQLTLAPPWNSTARAFPTTKHSARSYTATLAIVDEADFIPWLRQLMNAVRPTIDAGGRLILLSTADKDHPDSEFKRLWQHAIDDLSNFLPIFLPWHARPDRSQEWYDTLDYSEDDLFQEYPETPEQALAPRSESKRFHPSWIQQCFEPAKDLTPDQLWCIYRQPQQGTSYLLSADPAEGNPSSDPSAASVFNTETWEEVAHLHGRFEPHVFAGYLVKLSAIYNDAVICVERNNHGHAVHVALYNLDAGDLIYLNPHDKKDGWLSNAKYKTLAVDTTAEVLRDGSITIHTEATKSELAMFEAATLKAPEGFHDDRAMSLVIGIAALRWPSLRHQLTGESAVVEPEDTINEEETAGW